MLECDLITTLVQASVHLLLVAPVECQDSALIAQLLEQGVCTQVYWIMILFFLSEFL